MTDVQTVDDVYPALEELITELKSAGEPRLAAIIQHRVYQVAWTTRSELFEELERVLAGALETGETTLSRTLKDQIRRVLFVVRRFLRAEQS
jgi:hypothetical protein